MAPYGHVQTCISAAKSLTTEYYKMHSTLPGRKLLYNVKWRKQARTIWWNTTNEKQHCQRIAMRRITSIACVLQPVPLLSLPIRLYVTKLLSAKSPLSATITAFEYKSRLLVLKGTVTLSSRSVLLITICNISLWKIFLRNLYHFLQTSIVFNSRNLVQRESRLRRPLPQNAHGVYRPLEGLDCTKKK